MTISTEVRKAGPFIGNGSASAFPFAFKVFKAADLIVVRRQDNIDEETTLVLDSDYHVTLNSNQDTTPGGVVTLVAGALASSFTLVVSSELPYLQPTDLTNQGGFYPKVITNALDRLTIFCQQLAEITGRTLKLPITAPTNISAEIPLPNPSELIAWNETGTGLTTVSPQSLVTSIAYGSATADLFAGDGATTTFPLSTNPASVNNLDVSIDGHSQRPVQGGIGDYSWNGGASITFASPPPTPTVPGDKNVLVRYMQAIPLSDSEALHAQTREALRRSYAEAGYNLVDGSFETGGTLASTSDVLLLESAGTAYAWTGAYPVGGYDVAPGIAPTVVPGYVPRKNVLLKDAIGEIVKIYYSVAEMQSDAKAPASGYVGTLYYSAANDGGGATYVVKPAAEVPANGFTALALQNGNVACLVVRDRTLNIKQAGCKGDNTTNDRPALIAARDYLFANGGGILFAPVGKYKLSGGPFVLSKAGVSLVGQGMESRFITTSAGSPWGNLIHIGTGREWDGDTPTTSAPFTFVSATRDELESRNYANIKIEGVYVDNIHVINHHAADQGIGVWMLNARNCRASRIFASGCSVPVAIANDGPSAPESSNGTSEEACVDCWATDIYQIYGGKWYDIAFIGAAFRCGIRGAVLNTAYPSVMPAAVSINKGKRCVVSGLTATGGGNSTKIGAVGIELGSVSPEAAFNVVENNNLAIFAIGVVAYRTSKNIIRNNSFMDCTIGVDIYNTGNKVVNNDFENCTTAIKFRADAQQNRIVGNSGISKANVVFDVPVLVGANYFVGNDDFNGFRRYSIQPQQIVVPVTSASKVTAHYQGALVTNGTATDVFIDLKRDSDISYIGDLIFAMYNGGASDAIALTVHGRKFGDGNTATPATLYSGSISVPSAGDNTQAVSANINVSEYQSVTLKLSLSLSSTSQLRFVGYNTTVG